MNKYTVTYEYRGIVSVEVEAKNEKDAEDKGLDEADAYIAGNLTVYDARVRQIP